MNRPPITVNFAQTGRRILRSRSRTVAIYDRCDLPSPSAGKRTFQITTWSWRLTGAGFGETYSIKYPSFILSCLRCASELTR